jgi:hypothetical protein
MTVEEAPVTLEHFTVLNLVEVVMSNLKYALGRVHPDHFSSNLFIRSLIQGLVGSRIKLCHGSSQSSRKFDSAVKSILTTARAYSRQLLV